MQRASAAVVLFVLLALAGAAGLWWVSQDELPSGPMTGDPPQAAAPEDVRPEAMAAELAGAGAVAGVAQGSGREAVAGAEPSETPPHGPAVALSGRLVHPGNVAAAGVELAFRAFPQAHGEPRGLYEIELLSGSPGRTMTLPSNAPRTKSAADGTFSLPVPAATPGRLELTDDTLLFEKEETARLSPAREAVDLGVIGLIPAAEVAGIVKDERGVRLAGISVSLARQVEGPFGIMMMPGRLSTKTDDEGRFTLRGARAGKHELRTQSSRHVPGRQKLELEQGEKEHGIELVLAAGAVVGGRVVDDLGKPIAGMRVAAQRTQQVRGIVIDGFGGGESVQTDEQGAFTIGGLTEERVTLRATGKGHSPAVRDDVAVGSGDVVLEMRRNGGVRGRVVDGSGQPVAATRVFARPADREGFGFYMGGTATETDPNGEFELRDVGAGRMVVVASGDQHLEAESLPVDVRPGQVHDSVRITVQRGAMLEVVVTDGNGEPVRDATVEVRAPGSQVNDAVSWGTGDARRVVRRSVSRSAGGPPVLIDESGELLGSAKTDAEGRAKVGGLPAGAAVVDARHADLVRKDARHVTLPALGKVDAALTMVRGGHVDVRVVDANGRPAANETVLVELVGASDTEPMRARSGEDGLARIGPLAPGAYQALLALDPKPQGTGGFMILAFGSGPTKLESSRASVRIQEGAVATLQLRKPQLARVEGTVVDTGGVVAGAEVELHPDGQPRLPGLSGQYSAKTDAQGRFEIGDLPPGKYSLTWGRKDALVPGEDELELSEGQQLSRALAIPGGVLTLTVLSAGGEPLRGAQVSLTRGDAPQRSQRGAMVFRAALSNDEDEGTQSMQFGGPMNARTDEDGRATIRDLPAGKYSVAIRHRTHVSKGIADVQVPDPGEHDLGSVKLQQGASIRGTVVDAGGQPVPFAMAVLTPLEGKGEQRTMVQNGAFRFESLQPGRYRVRLEKLGPDRTEPTPQATEIEVLPGKPTPMRLTL